MYHCSVKIIGRSSGKSAVASAAYRSGEKLEDKETGLTYDFTKKHGVIKSEILLPPEAPKSFFNRQILWNEVQKIEKASDARFAREIEVALPREFTAQRQEEVVKEYVISNFVSKGMCADYALHDKGDGNPHAHIMLTTRAIKENGEWSLKSKKIYDLDQSGNKIFQKVDGSGRKIYKNHKEDYTDWNDRGKVEEWRADWARVCNQYLEKDKQLDHRSYERQGKEQIPTIHEGYIARKMEKNGKVSERCQINRDIKTYNSNIAYFTQMQSKFENLKDIFRSEIEKVKYTASKRRKGAK